MPYKSEKINIAGTKYDNRRKLTDDQIRAIRLLKEDGYSFRQLAAMFNISKWSVQNIIHPQKRSKVIKRPKSYWTQKKKEYRARKQRLYLSGKIYEKKRKQKNRN